MLMQVPSKLPTARMARNHWFLLSCAIAILWSIFSLPAILLSGVFPMDIEAYYRIHSRFDAWLPWILWPEVGPGRYYPFYWLFHTAEFALFGMSAAGFLTVQSIVLAVGCGLAAFLITRTTRSARLTLLVIVLWYFNTPLAENISTIGKSEPLACSLMLIAVAIFYQYILRKSDSIGHKRIVWPLFCCGFVVLLAICTKETSFVALGVALTGLVLSLTLSIVWKSADIKAQAVSYFRLLCALLCSVLVSQAHHLRQGVPLRGTPSASETAGQYATFKMTGPLVIANMKWYIEQQPDVFAFAVAASILLAVVGRSLWRDGRQAASASVRDYVFMSSMYAAAAVYYCAMWFWRWPMGYYMLFPSVIFKICFIYGLHATRVWERGRALIRWSAIAFVGSGVVYAAVYSFYVISSQVSYSRLYTDALSRLLELPGSEKTLIFESYPFYSQQVGSTQYILQYLIERRGDNQHIAVNGIVDTLDPFVVDPERPGNAELMRMLGVTAEALEENFQHLPKKGDYVLTFTGRELATWFVRGVAPYYSEKSELQEQGAYDMRLVADERETIPGIYFNVWTGRPACEKRWLGYKLYQVVDEQPKFFWRGRYPDGWTEATSSLSVSPSYDHPVVIKFSSPKDSLPQNIIIKKDGEFFKKYQILNTDEQSLLLADQVDKAVKFEFLLEHTVPPETRLAKQEMRRVGVLMRLDTMQTPHAPSAAASCFSLERN